MLIRYDRDVGSPLANTKPAYQMDLKGFLLIWRLFEMSNVLDSIFYIFIPEEWKFVLYQDMIPCYNYYRGSWAQWGNVRSAWISSCFSLHTLQYTHRPELLIPILIPGVSLMVTATMTTLVYIFFRVLTQ